MGSIGAIFTSTYQHKAAKSMAKLISQSYQELLLVVCLSRGDEAIWRPPEHLWMSEKPQKQATIKISLGNVQHQYLAELFVKVYSYCLIVKNVSWCCVRGSWSFSNPVTSCMCSYHQSYSSLLKLNILHVQTLSFGSCTWSWLAC